MVKSGGTRNKGGTKFKQRAANIHLSYSYFYGSYESDILPLNKIIMDESVILFTASYEA